PDRQAARAIPALESALGSHPCGALSSVRVPSILKQTFWRQSVKSQGFGDRVPESEKPPFLIDVVVPSSSFQVEPCRSPVVETLVRTLLVVKPEVFPDSGACFRHRPIILQVHLFILER